MTSETTKVKSNLSSLSNSLDELEATLEPLFAQSLPGFMANLDKMQQAKLQVVLPYLIYDLIFIYLKSRGIDPKTHPVIAELERVRQYFGKITSAEDPAKKRLEIDKSAAGRFIKHAIAQAKTAQMPSSTGPEPELDPDPVLAGPSRETRVPPSIKVTKKMRERARYENELAMADATRGRAEEEEEAEGLRVWDSVPPDDEDEEMEEGEGLEESTGKGKEKATEDDGSLPAMHGWTKRRRPAVDPFAGYRDDLSTSD